MLYFRGPESENKNGFRKNPHCSGWLKRPRLLREGKAKPGRSSLALGSK